METANELTVLFFGPLAEITGTGSVQITGCADTDSLLEELTKKFPGLVHQIFLLAVDKNMIHSNTTLEGKKTIAFLPPYAGG